MSKRPDSREQLLRAPKVFNYLKKFWICDGLRRGSVTREEIIGAHNVSDEELDRWIERYQRGGLSGLKTINIQRKRAA